MFEFLFSNSRTDLLSKRIDTLTQRIDTLVQRNDMLTQRDDRLSERIAILSRRDESLQENLISAFSEISQLKETIKTLRYLLLFSNTPAKDLSHPLTHPQLAELSEKAEAMCKKWGSGDYSM